MIGIVNASPLIYLGKLGKLDLLQNIFSQILTTEQVKLEVLSLETVPELVVLEEAFNSWIKIKNPQNLSLVKKLERLNIHKGEASILSLAKELVDQGKKAVVIIDDLAAREIARAMGLTITGTVGTLLRGLKQDLLTQKEFKFLLTRLTTDTSFRMTSRLYSRLLSKLDNLEREEGE